MELAAMRESGELLVFLKQYVELSVDLKQKIINEQLSKATLVHLEEIDLKELDFPMGPRKNLMGIIQCLNSNNSKHPQPNNNKHPHLFSSKYLHINNKFPHFNYNRRPHFNSKRPHFNSKHQYLNKPIIDYRSKTCQH